jgi:hypothetical protein
MASRPFSIDRYTPAVPHYTHVLTNARLDCSLKNSHSVLNLKWDSEGPDGEER